ncbi:hypothetical protein Smp_037430 [Schistosoma mansoni]|uniref:hypothetical protein n=1 Tax=Schistosoma mansoni TaxID=6183 RepID=UPI0001A6361A|nr:hypothetical protein Smp_037430 [Schistosoma mansoni]|eukprot:XP_018645334.1 hypothetical protein Smp_037430 [Schistosoma mansoni]
MSLPDFTTVLTMRQHRPNEFLKMEFRICASAFNYVFIILFFLQKMQQLISLCCKVMKMNMKRPRREIKMLTAGETVIIIIILITANKFETASRKYTMVLLLNVVTFDTVVYECYALLPSKSACKIYVLINNTSNKDEKRLLYSK